MRSPSVLCRMTDSPVQWSVKSSISSPSSLYTPSISWLKFKPGNSLKIINSKVKGPTGSFKLVPKNKRISQPREMCARMALKKLREIKEKGPKKASDTKKDPPNPNEVTNVPKKPDEVKKTPS